MNLKEKVSSTVHTLKLEDKAAAPPATLRPVGFPHNQKFHPAIPQTFDHFFPF
jgi:hypothetical protein